MQAWSKFISRTAWFWIFAWLAASIVCWFAPKIPSLLGEESKGFLPPGMPSQRAMTLLKEEFPDAAYASRAVVVFVRDAGLTAEDKQVIANLSSQLAEKSNEFKWHVTAASLNPVLKPMLESSDQKAAIILVELPAGSLSRHTVNRFRQIEKAAGSLPKPPGLQYEITGGAAMGGLIEANAHRDVDKTTIWALAAVAAILLFVYRSPVAMLLPMATIAAALIVSLGLVGWLASLGWPINSLVQMFMVVIVVGVGTDYCLFLFARFREDVVDAPGLRQAALSAITQAGPAVLASAGTNALGLATLWFALNRDLNTSGPTIGLSIVICGVCVMTLSASLIYLCGLWLVRRKGKMRSRDPRLWTWAAEVVARRPRAVTLAVGTLLLWASLLGAWKRNEPIYDSLDQFPAQSSFVRGARLYEHHFQNDKPVAEATVLVTFPERLDGPESADVVRKQLDEMYKAVKERFSVIYYRDLLDPLGMWREPQPQRSESLPVPRRLIEQFARPNYLGKSGKTLRLDLGLEIEPRSIPAMKAMPQIQHIIAEVARQSGAIVSVDVAGENAVYADMRNLRIRDFAVVAVAAMSMIFLVLLWLLRSALQSAILIIATLLTYLSAYGITWIIVRVAFGSLALAWQIDFLLFIVVLSLGQDYNIFVVARVHEELKRHNPREAVATAIRRTGSVVSSCGVIMAATFASMFSGSLLMMKEFAIALSLAMLIDTFIVRPLLVPALILLAYRISQPDTDAAESTKVPVAGLI